MAKVSEPGNPEKQWSHCLGARNHQWRSGKTSSGFRRNRNPLFRPTRKGRQNTTRGKDWKICGVCEDRVI